ncbi:hypothetical protein AALA98_12630 [Lachnospiraceae bacterium 45-W7]
MKKYWILCIAAVSILLMCGARQRTEAAETAEQQAAAVEVPQNLNFYLDPQNEGGRGQIYSDKYRIRNAGKEAVILSMELALSILEEQADITFCPEKWDTEPEDRSIYMYAVFEGSWGEDKGILTSETSCREKIILQPAGMEGDAVYISFGGTLSKSKKWKSGELGINAFYTVAVDSREYQASINGNHIRIKDGGVKITDGQNMELSLVPDEGYFLPADVQVYMGGVQIQAIYNMADGKIVLENVSDNVVVCANGITKATLPDIEIMDMGKAVWSWTADTGIEAYEYIFLQDGQQISSGRFGVEDGIVSWNWSEGLESGSYVLRLKAIGDMVHCLNSEEGNYPVTVDRTVLEPPEEIIMEPEGQTEDELSKTSKETDSPETEEETADEND